MKRSVKSEVLRELNALSISLSKTNAMVLQIKANVKIVEDRKNTLTICMHEIESKRNLLVPQLELELSRLHKDIDVVQEDIRRRKEEKGKLVSEVKLLRQKTNEAQEKSELIGFAVKGVMSEVAMVENNEATEKASDFVEQRELSKALLSVVEIRQLLRVLVTHADMAPAFRTPDLPGAVPIETYNRMEDIINEASTKAASLSKDVKRQGKQAELLQLVSELLEVYVPIFNYSISLA